MEGENFEQQAPVRMEVDGGGVEGEDFEQECHNDYQLQDAPDEWAEHGEPSGVVAPSLAVPSAVAATLSGKGPQHFDLTTEDSRDNTPFRPAPESESHGTRGAATHGRGLGHFAWGAGSSGTSNEAPPQAESAVATVRPSRDTKDMPADRESGRAQRGSNTTSELSAILARRKKLADHGPNASS